MPVKSDFARLVVAAALLSSAVAARATAQKPDSVKARDTTSTTPRPAERVGVAGSAPADTGTNRYLALQQRTSVVLPVLPRLAESAPAPAFARVVFDRDSIEWLNVATVGDLVARIPGAYVWRGGRLGRPEPVNMQGRGASSVHYVLDGMPYVPAGPDSLAVDPSLFSLNFLDRVEIERWPGLLEVRLYTRRHDRLAPRSRIVVASGSDKLAMYSGELEQRTRRGLGFVLAGDYVKAPPSTASTGAFTNSQLWVQGSYVPSPRFGLQYQLIRPSIDRDAFTSDAGALGSALEGKRTDAQFRASYGVSAGPAAPRIDLVYARTGWDSAGITQQINQLGGMASVQRAAFSGGVSAFRRGRWTSFDSRAWLGWSPATAITASGQAVFQHHFGGRSSRWVGLRGGVALPLGLSVGGALRAGTEVAAPSIITDTAQTLHDVQLTAGLERGWVGGEATYSRNAAYSPFGYQAFPGIVSLAPHASTEWVTLAGHLAPWRWLVVDGWYANPRTATPDGVPPRHYAANGTIRSKFLRQFPSGYFQLKLAIGVEGWQAGTIGRDAVGAPVLLPAARFLRSQVQMEIGSLTVFWDSRNVGGSRAAYVPGFRIPRYSSAFGIRWEFLN
ncbi:MAG: TonB-dependent receptor plug domain-containing protein [Gemmatimonadota bacterium]